MEKYYYLDNGVIITKDNKKYYFINVLVRPYNFVTRVFTNEDVFKDFENYDEFYEVSDLISKRYNSKNNTFSYYIEQ